MRQAWTMLLAALLAAGCSKMLPGGDDKALPDTALTKIELDRHYFKDQHGRYLYINGINVSGTSKLPVTPAPDDDPRKGPISFVGRPFPIEEADDWFARIRNEMGFNSIRLVVAWEAIEHQGRGQYDTEYLDYLEELVKKANDHGIYVLINFHENLFSRFFYANFSRNPELGEPGSVEYMLSTLFPNSKTMAYDGRITGDGAPRWAVEACVPEKNIDSPNWGMSHIMAPLGDLYMSLQIFQYVDKLLGLTGEVGGEGDGGGGVSLEDWLLDMVAQMKKADPPLLPFDVTETCDVYPFTNWWNNVALSYDIERCYAAFYAGDKVFPGYKFDVDGKQVDIKEYLQGAYAGAWVEVVKRVKKYPNVIGYDLVNEPPSAFIVLMAVAIYTAENFNEDAVEDWLSTLIGQELGQSITRLLFVLNVLPAIPSKDFFDTYIDSHTGEFNTFKNDNPDSCADAKPEGGQTEEEAIDACFRDGFYDHYVYKYKESRGLNDINAGGVLDLNLSYVVHLVEMYRRVGKAIMAEQPDAIIWLEGGGGAFDDLLGAAVGAVNLYKPQELDQIVFSPHWYPDIYPFLGFNEPPRNFVVEEWMVRDFTPEIESSIKNASQTFGPIPVVFGEFGTYFNYNGIEQSIKDDYAISKEILNNYYESFETLFAHRMLWNLSADNTNDKGDLWNAEDFSIVGPGGKVRGELAWSRPTPLVLSGKPVELRFNSDFHFYDPEKGEPDPWREFYLSFESKESDMPTEIFVPEYQYPDGFYVWLSDGWAVYDHDRHTLYYYPTKDDPGWVHEMTIRPPQEGAERNHFSYFFDGEQVLVGDRL